MGNAEAGKIAVSHRLTRFGELVDVQGLRRSSAASPLRVKFVRHT